MKIKWRLAEKPTGPYRSFYPPSLATGLGRRSPRSLAQLYKWPGVLQAYL